MTNQSKQLFPRLLFSVMLFCIAFFFPVTAGAESMLESGYIVNARMKSLAAGTSLSPWEETDDIRAVRMADSLPDNFVPSDANTVSTADSEYPIFIFFSNENEAGIIYFYTDDERIRMNPDSGYLFACNKALTDISGVANWDTSAVVSMNGLFMRDSSLADISPLSGWNVQSVVWLSQAFLLNTSLTDISALAAWDTSNVTSMNSLFCEAENIQDALALRNWDTSNVTDMGYMFSGANSIAVIDVSNWDTSKVTEMGGMFQVGDSWAGNGRLREILGIGNWDVSNVTDMTCMFYGAGQMTYYDIAGWDVSRVESMNHMFCDNFNLRSLDLSAWDVSNVKTMYCMFDDNYKLKTIGDVSRWNTASLVDTGGWLNGASSFIGDNTGTLDLSGWDTKKLKAAGEMFRGTQIRTIDLSGWIFDSITNDNWEGAGEGIFYETGNNVTACKGLGLMFKDTSQLSTVYVSEEGMESYKTVTENGAGTLDMWTGSKTNGFTIK